MDCENCITLRLNRDHWRRQAVAERANAANWAAQCARLEDAATALRLELELLKEGKS